MKTCIERNCEAPRPGRHRLFCPEHDVNQMKPFAWIPGSSKDYEDSEQWTAVDEAVGRRRHSTRNANLGTFIGYRIGLDIGNGNIGWCVLFEEGMRLRFMTAEDLIAHNRSLPRTTRTQLPDLAGFVPTGTHKFDARETNQHGQKSLSKVRAEARAARRMLDARQFRRLHVDKALREAGLLPAKGKDPGGHSKIKADVLRVKLLDPSFDTHPHDLGRALKNALKRRGYLKPIGRRGADEGSGFATQTETAYRRALEKYECRTIGEFLERCASDAKRDGVPFRKRHRSLAWQRKNSKKQPNKSDDVSSYETFRFLTPTFSLIRKECRLLKKMSGIEIDDEAWAGIEEAAEFRRPLKSKTPGRCQYFPNEYRCVAALPSFQQYRILENISNLRDRNRRKLDDTDFDTVRNLLETQEKVTLAELKEKLRLKLKLDQGDAAGSRQLVGAKTDIALGNVFGDTWRNLPIEQRDEWTMRFLRRHWPQIGNGQSPAWSRDDEEALECEAKATFGEDALEKVDGSDVAKNLEDRFSSISVKAARLLGDCYEQRLGYDERLARLRQAGAPQPELALYERLPYYGEVMPDETVPAEGFAPKERTVAEELRHGRAANPDVHVVMNRLRVVVNAIIEMMGGILPTRCVIEMARSTFSEEQAAAHSRTARARHTLRQNIESEIEKVYRSKMPTGPALDRLVDRWKAAIRQGWRDYDGSEIPRSALVDGSEYQLDHVEPAAFGDFREDNIFVSRFNRQKGRRLPWEVFGDDPRFQPALVAFATFGLNKKIETSEQILRARPGMRQTERDRREAALERARRNRDRLHNFANPDPRVTQSLQRPSVVSDADSEEESQTTRRRVQPFRPASQAALFCRFHPDWSPRENGPAARDTANIGWSTKLARRYLRHVGARTEPIKAWAVHALRCMFGINKPREDLRNHAVDAFLVAHFDHHVLKPAFDRLRHQRAYEELYASRALQTALDRINYGDPLFQDFQRNLDTLERVLPTIYTAHRADNRWNPGDKVGSGLGTFGGENIYAFRPTLEKRKELTALFRKEGLVPENIPVLDKKEILTRYNEIPKQSQEGKRLAKKIANKMELRYYSDRDKNKVSTLKLKTAQPLSRQPGAFIDAESKFALVGGVQASQRQILSTIDFSRKNAEGRSEVFSVERPVYRRGDTVIQEEKSYLITGIMQDRRLIAYPVNEAERKQDQKKLISISGDIAKFASDVLGRRLHQLGKGAGGLQPVPYPLRGE